MNYLIAVVIIAIVTWLIGRYWYNQGGSEPAIGYVFAIIAGVIIFIVFSVGYFLGSKEPEKQCEISYTHTDGTARKSMIDCSQIK